MKNMLEVNEHSNMLLKCVEVCASFRIHEGVILHLYIIYYCLIFQFSSCYAYEPSICRRAKPPFSIFYRLIEA